MTLKEGDLLIAMVNVSSFYTKGRIYTFRFTPQSMGHLEKFIPWIGIARHDLGYPDTAPMAWFKAVKDMSKLEIALYGV